MRSLLKVLKGQIKEISQNESSSTSTEKIGEKEYQRFLKIYDTLTHAPAFGEPKFNKPQAKALAEIFCKENQFDKFNDFLKMYGDLTHAPAFGEPKFNKEDAIDIIFKRLNLTKPLLVYWKN